MNAYNPDAEATLEKETLALFEELGWQTLDAYHERYSEGGGGNVPDLGHANRGEVILRSRLRTALNRLNPSLPPMALDVGFKCEQSGLTTFRMFCETIFVSLLKRV